MTNILIENYNQKFKINIKYENFSIFINQIKTVTSVIKILFLNNCLHNFNINISF